MANIIDKRTVGDILLITTDINPMDGTIAPIGSICFALDGTGNFTKTGSLDTEWSENITTKNLGNKFIISVNKNPNMGQFSDPALAVAAADLIVTPTQPVLIRFNPGVYDISDTLVINYNIILDGLSSGAATIHITDSSKDVLSLRSGSTVKNLTLSGSSDFGKFGIVYENSIFGDAPSIDGVTVGGSYGYANISNLGVPSQIVFNNISVSQGSGLQRGIVVTGDGANFMGVVISNSLIGDLGAPIGTFISAQGIGVLLVMNNITSTNLGLFGDCFLEIFDGVELHADRLAIDSYTLGVSNPNVGIACKVDLVAIELRNCIEDIRIDHPSSISIINGVIQMDKSTFNPTANITLLVTDPDTTDINVSGTINKRFNSGLITDISTLITESSTMGVMEGGDMTAGSGFDVDITAGYGYFEQFPDNDVIQRVDWNNSTITLSSNLDVFIYFNSNAILTYSGSEPDTRHSILLGRVVTNTAGIEFVDSSPSIAEHTSNRISDNLKNAIGPVYSNGSSVVENVSPRKINVSGGQYYYGENRFIPSGGNALVFTAIYGQGTGVLNNQDTIDNTQYDLSGVLTNLTSGYYAKGSLYLVGDGSNEKYYYVYPQTQHSTLLSVQQADISLPPNTFNGSVVLIAGIIIQQGNNNIVQVVDQRPVIGFRSSGVNASADHLSLLNLNGGAFGDGGHTNLLTVNGSRNMTGDLNMGTNNIINVGTFNSVNIESHSSRHLPNGTDPLSSGTASTIGTTNLPGIQNAFSRQDHIHAHGNQTNPSLHAVGTSLVNGFISSTDWNTFNNKQDLLISATNIKTINSISLLGSGNINLTIGTLSDVNITSPQDNQLLRYDNVSSKWINYTHQITLNGDVTGVGLTGITTSISNATVTSKLLTGYISGSGVVSSSDSILQAIQKLNGNITSLVTGVSGVTGSSNRITSSGGSNPIIDISSSYIGQTSITTLGTITTGVWNGTPISNIDLANSTITIGTTPIGLGSSSITLTGLTSITSTTFVGTLSGNSTTSTTLQTARNINGVSFNGSSSITVTADANTLTSTILNSTVVTSSLTSVGTITTGVWNGTAIANGNLANSSITIGSTSVSLGSTVTTLTGLSSITSTAFVGALTGNSTTSTTLQTSRNINGVSFNGSANITVTSAAGTLTGTTLNSSVVTSSLTSVGTITSGVWNGTAISNSNLANSSVTIGSTSISLGTTVTSFTGLTSITSTTFVGSLTGNSTTTTTLQTARTINGVSFDGSSNITVTAAAGTLTGSILNSSVVTSSLTSVGTITTGVWNGTAIANGNLANSSVTIGSTNISLGSTVTTFTGLTSITSTAFVGSLTGNSTTSTTLQTSRNINGVSFDGSTNITVTAAAGTLTGTTLNSSVVASSLTSVGTITTGVWNGTAISNSNLANSSITIGSTSVSLGSTVTTFVGLSSITSTTFVGSLTGNSTTSTTLQTARTINGVSFDGSTNITVTAAAVTLTGTTLNSSIVTSSLTSVGTITTGVWNGTAIAAVNGGTGQTVYAVGDILTANTTTTLSKLADVATGNVLVSGGVGVVPSYGKVGLTTHVSGILAGTNGGTGVNNGSFLITLAGNLTTTGAFNTTFATSVSGTYTLPTATSTLLANNLGISGGTTLIGGSATTDTLILKSTSGVGASGANIIFQVGNNGATEAMRILNSGLIGFGVTTPTTFGDFAASTTSNASTRILAGTAPSAANQNIGDIWNDSTKKTLSVNLNGASTIVQNLETVVFTQTANQNFSGTTTETTTIGTGQGTKTLPANFFTLGKTIRVIIRGFLSRNSNAQFRFKLGSTTIATSASASFGAGTNVGFEVIVECTCRTIGATGTVFAQGKFTNLNANTSLDIVSTAATTIDTTASQIIDVTGQFSTNNAGNSITSTNCTIEILN